MSSSATLSNYPSVNSYIGQGNILRSALGNVQGTNRENKFRVKFVPVTPTLIPKPAGASADHINQLLEQFIRKVGDDQYVQQSSLVKAWNDVSAGQPGILPLDMVCDDKKEPVARNQYEYCAFASKSKQCQASLLKLDAKPFDKSTAEFGPEYSGCLVCPKHWDHLQRLCAKYEMRKEMQCSKILERGPRAGFKCGKRKVAGLECCRAHLNKTVIKEAIDKARQDGMETFVERVKKVSSDCPNYIS